MINFYTILIDHYEERIQDKSVPLMVRADFKRTLAAYQSSYENLKSYCANHSTIKSFTMSMITSVPNIKASDIINTAEQLKKKNLNQTTVNVIVYDDHISIVDASDDHLLSYIKRDVKSSG